MDEFKDILLFLRKSRGLSQKQLAEKLDISTSTIGMYESGKRFPTREIEEAIADYFNVNLSELRGKTAPPHKQIELDLTMSQLSEETIARLNAVLGELNDGEANEMIKYAEYLINRREW